MDNLKLIIQAENNKPQKTKTKTVPRFLVVISSWVGIYFLSLTDALIPWLKKADGFVTGRRDRVFNFWKHWDFEFLLEKKKSIVFPAESFMKTKLIQSREIHWHHQQTKNLPGRYGTHSFVPCWLKVAFMCCSEVV